MGRERIKPITLNDTETGKEYTLEFNRKTIVMAENAGLDLLNGTAKPATTILTLWYYAFKMHHPTITQVQAEKLFDNLGTIPDGLVERLIELYQAGMESLCDENPKATVVL